MSNAPLEKHPQLHLVLHERAETALRYLTEKDRERVMAHLPILEVLSPEKIKQSYKRLQSQSGSPTHYILRLTPKLRAIFRYADDNTVIVEDIVAHELLARFRRVAS